MKLKLGQKYFFRTAGYTFLKRYQHCFSGTYAGKKNGKLVFEGSGAKPIDPKKIIEIVAEN